MALRVFGIAVVAVVGWTIAAWSGAPTHPGFSQPLVSGAATGATSGAGDRVYAMSSGVRKSECKRLGGNKVKIDGIAGCALFTDTCPVGWRSFGEPVMRMQQICGPTRCTGRNSQGDCIRSVYCKSVEARSITCLK